MCVYECTCVCSNGDVGATICTKYIHMYVLMYIHMYVHIHTYI